MTKHTSMFMFTLAAGLLSTGACGSVEDTGLEGPSVGGQVADLAEADKRKDDKHHGGKDDCKDKDKRRGGKGDCKDKSFSFDGNDGSDVEGFEDCEDDDCLELTAKKGKVEFSDRDIDGTYRVRVRYESKGKKCTLRAAGSEKTLESTVPEAKKDIETLWFGELELDEDITLKVKDCKEFVLHSVKLVYAD